MADEPYTAEEVDRAVAALGDPDRFTHAQEIVAHAAPGLQRVLIQALGAGGWFDQAHEAEVSRTTGIADAAERLDAVRALIEDETRLAMLVGAAVGLELGEQLRRQRDEGET